MHSDPSVELKPLVCLDEELLTGIVSLEDDSIADETASLEDVSVTGGIVSLKEDSIAGAYSCEELETSCWAELGIDVSGCEGESSLQLAHRVANEAIMNLFPVAFE